MMSLLGSATSVHIIRPGVGCYITGEWFGRSTQVVIWQVSRELLINRHASLSFLRQAASDVLVGIATLSLIQLFENNVHFLKTAIAHNMQQQK